MIGIDLSSRRRIAAVILQETRSLSRQKAPFILRGLYAASLVGVVMLVSLDIAGEKPTGDTLAELGQLSFGVVSSLQILLALALGAFLGIASIHSERLNKTLGLLVLSRLHSWEVVVGKLLALFSLLVTVLLAGLPIFALIGWAGGVDYLWLTRLLLLTLLLAPASIATGLVGAIMVRSVGLATCVVIAILFLPIVLGVAHSEGYLVSWVAGLAGSPLTAAVEIVTQDGDDAKSWHWLSAVFLAHWTLAALALAAAGLPRAVAASPGRGLRGAFEKLDGLYERINFGGIRFGGGDVRRVRGNPVTWLAYLSGGSDLPRYRFRWIAFTLAALLLAMNLWLFGEAWRGLIIMCGYVVFLFAPIVAGANAFGTERSRRTLSTLLATPLSARSLIFGKLGAVRRLYLYLTLPSIVLLAFGTAFEFGSFEDVMAAFAVLLVESFCAYCVTLLFASSQRNALRGGVAGLTAYGGMHVVALLVAVGTLIILEGEYLAVLVPMMLGWLALNFTGLVQAKRDGLIGRFNLAAFGLATSFASISLTWAAHAADSGRLFYWLFLIALFSMSIFSLTLLIVGFDRIMERAT